MKLFSHLIALNSFYRSYCFTLPSSVWVRLWSKISENVFFGFSCAETLFLTKTTNFCSFVLKISLLLISATIFYPSIIPSHMSAAGEETSEQETSYCLQWKLYCYSSPSRLTLEHFVSPCAFCIYFVFFVFVFWPSKALLQTFREWVTQNPQKILSKSH